MYNKKLIIAVDMFGCPNRCKHCWIGHMQNIKMQDDSDRDILEYFYPYFDKIEFYSWLRDPDYCDDYRDRWFQDIQLSKNAAPSRFELASFYRIVRDEKYIPFLKEVGVKKVQLTFFGLQETQDFYCGRKGAYDEIMLASDKLIESGIVPRWQCFINEENKDEIVEISKIAQKIKLGKCPELEFFVHEGSCDGENRKLYPIRIRKQNIPTELEEYYLNFNNIITEKECCQILENDFSHPKFHNENDIVIYISNQFDVFFNFTNMSKPWIIGNLKNEQPEELIRKIVNEDTFAINEAEKVVWAELVQKYGDFNSDRVFSLDDYKMYLYNRYLDDNILFDNNMVTR